jgi:hypothetical protein
MGKRSIPVALLLPALLACAVAPKTKAPSNGPAAERPADPADPVGELDRLEGEIAAGLTLLRLEPTPVAPALAPPPSTTPTPESSPNGYSLNGEGTKDEPPEPPISGTDATARPADSAAEISRGGRVKSFKPGGSLTELLRERRAAKDAKKREEETCQKTCEIVDAICDAAERICQIADRMPPESGAAPRCERARTECSRARAQVAACGCS